MVPNARNGPIGGVRYPAAMLLPLVLVAAALFLARTFTRDMTPVLPTHIGRIRLNTFADVPDDETMTEERT